MKICNRCRCNLEILLNQFVLLDLQIGITRIGKPDFVLCLSGINFSELFFKLCSVRRLQITRIEFFHFYINLWLDLENIFHLFSIEFIIGILAVADTCHDACRIKVAVCIQDCDKCLMRAFKICYKGGIVPLAEYAARPYDRDLLVRVIVPKEPAAFCYQSVRNSQTDFPVLTCAAAKTAEGYCFAIGARPGKAVRFDLTPNAAETPELLADRFAAEVRAAIKTESNLRGSAEYRNHLAGVLVKRAVRQLEG